MTHPMGTSSCASACSASAMARRISCSGSDICSSDRDDRGDFGDFFAKVALDPHLQGHGAAGTAVTGAVETDLHDAVGGDVHKLDVAAVGLDGRADQVDHALHFLTDRLWLRGSGHRALVGCDRL